MTIKEREKVKIVAKELFGNEGDHDQKEWNDLLWEIYDALIKAELI